MYGQIGVLEYDSEDKIQCHICGRWYRGLNNHVWKTHGWTADDYREEFGLNRGQSLICEGTRQKLSEINKEQGNWKHLISQTSTKEELARFLRSIAPNRPIKLRAQACLFKSEMLTSYNPMNKPDVHEKAVATLRKTWYGTPKMKDLSRRNLAATIERRRQNHLEERRYTCPCGVAFATRKEGEHHRAKCSVAHADVIRRQQESRHQWWENVSPEIKEEYRQHMRDMRKERKIWRPR